MALYHFTVSQIGRSGGSSAIAAAAYRSGQRLHSERYDEVNDYTNKGGVIMSEIMLPPQAPKEYEDRETLWNAVEASERSRNAQLAYSFEFSLQNEFTPEENEELARQFIRDNFVAKGMIADFAIHNPERSPGGIANPHVHVMCPQRPIKEDGTWDFKQRRVPLFDETGAPIMDERTGKQKFDAVRTTDWSDPETLEQWRKNWADLCNAKFAEKGLPNRIDNRSYERQGIDLIPQIHEGPTVRAMEKKGIPTEKGAFNRWVKAANKTLRSIQSCLADLLDWIRFAKEELNKPHMPTVKEILGEYLEQQRVGAQNYSRYGRQKANIRTLQDVTSAWAYLDEHNIGTPQDLEDCIQALADTTAALKTTMDEKSKRMKQLREAISQADVFKQNHAVYAELSKPKYKFKKAAEAYKSQHDSELRLFFRARRILKDAGMTEYDSAVVKSWKKELIQLEQSYNDNFAMLRPAREEQKKLWHIRYCVDRVLKENTGKAIDHTKRKEDVDR